MPLHLLSGIRSGFFIALIAMPLCLGIAIASSCPPIAGIITAIIGGIIVSFLGGCKLSIKGPAAGLIVIVMGAVMELGAGDLTAGYKKFLAIAVIAALLQIILVFFKTARFGRLMPPSVIHGMLAAIGIIIVAKQIHILVGATPHQKTTLALIGEVPHSILNINPELAFIGIFTLACMILIPLIPSKIIKIIPPALVALFVVVPLGIIWHLKIPHSYHVLDHDFLVGPSNLVNIPSNIFNSLVFPDFSVLMEPTAYKFIIMLALIGSIESVLTVIAVDSIDQTKTKSNLNKDLLGIGIGNLICAFIGGLPMISEVVRSKANIDNGAKDHWSNFFHGCFLLIAVVWAAPLIQQIPLAALAAMLIVTGLRLASPSTFIKTYKIGIDQLALFMTTLVVTLCSDLLVGITTGMLLKIIIHLIRGVKLKTIISISVRVDQLPTYSQITVLGPAIFSNYFSLQKYINRELNTNKKVIVDFTQANLVDHTTLSCLYSWIDEIGIDRLNLIGLEKLSKNSDHPLSTHKFA
ncbi:MAG: SulP family inorganic anion transporter [Myxococcales bacterium]|nr:SulP family inorganic anion transporter [Myxococcales bacterium]USN49803.1 MAG: SulP family inorganic anion transporter [Myxococcales bacterium]